MNYYNFCVLLIALIVVILLTMKINVIESYSDPKIDELRNKLIQVEPRAQNLVFRASDQSFTEDKKYVYLCLKDKNTGQYYDDNMLMYVCLHELAHAISKTVDEQHTGDEFNNNFKMLLKKAEQLGFYDSKKPLNYSYCPKL